MLNVIFSSSFCGLLSTTSSDVVLVDRNADSSCSKRNSKQNSRRSQAGQLLWRHCAGTADGARGRPSTRLHTQHTPWLTSTSSRNITTAAAIDSHAPVRVASVKSLRQQQHHSIEQQPREP